MTRRLRLASLLLVILGAFSSAVRGQHVVSTTGDGVVLSVGSESGVRKGAKGSLCAPELVGGRIVRNCSARFVIVSVSGRRSTARITKGAGSDIRPSMLADFDVPLVKPEPPSRPKETRTPPKRDPKVEAAKAFREASRAFEEGDYSGAAERYENYVRNFPDVANLGEAKSRAEESRARLAEIMAPPPPPPPPAIPAALLQADQLAATAEELFASGRFTEARNSAIDALKRDSTNARAIAALSAIRTKTVQSRFHGPADVAVTSSGECYVADAANNTIRRIANGTTTTFAGAAGDDGATDGRAGLARFNDPVGVAVGSDGSVFVVDRYNATVRRISPDGVVTTIAGRPGVTGATDASASAARFNGPRRIAVSAHGTAYVSDSENHAIRRISADGAVTTLLAGSFERIDPAGLFVDREGDVLFADAWNHVLRRIDRDGRMSIIAGIVGSSGSTDGPAATARFNAPEGVAADADGNIYVSDTGNHTIRRIANGIVTTIAGRAGLSGAVDGTSMTARLNRPSGIACDARGNLWIADTGNHTVRLLTDGFVETIAGLAGATGSADGAN